MLPTKPFLTSLFLALSIALTTPASSQPNVLLITTDDMNCDLAAYGHPLVNSPNLNRLASRGLLFERAYCQYPVCNPSRSSFMTGLYPESTGILSNAGHFRENIPEVVTMPEHFRNHGYFAARVGKIYHYAVPTDIGNDGGDDPQSWDEVRNPIGIDKAVEPDINTLQEGKFGGTLSWLKVASKDEDHTDGIGTTDAIDLLETHHPDKTGKPFFIAMGFYRPHTPFVAPPHYFDLYPTDQIDPVLLDPNDRNDIPKAALPDRAHQLDLTLAQRKEIIQAYYASISLVDTQVGRLLDALDRLDLTDNTIVVFFSDHGYHLGHHGLWQKSDLFEGSTRVPLIFSVPMPDMAQGTTTQSLVELIDVYPTLNDLCGLPRPKHLQGASLIPILENPLATVRNTAYSVTESRTVKRDDNSKFLGRTIRTDRYRYTEWDDGEFGVELYDYKNDPEELTNLAPNPEKADLRKQLRTQLRARKKTASSGL
ncbi:MAG: sulfatase [Verrucomicrobiota bacterium]